MSQNLLAFRLTAHAEQTLSTNATNLDELTRQLPQGLYTTFATSHNGTRVMGLSAHLSRLYVPAREMKIRPVLTEAELRKVLVKLTAKLLPRESRVRLTLSTSESRGEMFVALQPFSPLPPEVYEHGVHVMTTSMARQNPRLKSTSFIEASQNQRGQISEDIFEVLLTKNGRILEGMTSNFYGIIENQLITAQRGILLGVTRRSVLRLARGQGMPIAYRAPRVDERFDEAFLTSSSRGIVPIVRIDDSRVGEEKVGDWTKRLMNAYQLYVEARSERI